MTTIRKTTHFYQNIPKGGGKKSTAITSNNISVSREGVVNIGKGKVYMKTAADILNPVVVSDEYGNFVEMVRHSDKADLAPSTGIGGPYKNNQTIIKRRSKRRTKKDGSISQQFWPSYDS